MNLFDFSYKPICCYFNYEQSKDIRNKHKQILENQGFNTSNYPTVTDETGFEICLIPNEQYWNSNQGTYDEFKSETLNCFSQVKELKKLNLDNAGKSYNAHIGHILLKYRPALTHGWFDFIYEGVGIDNYFDKEGSKALEFLENLKDIFDNEMIIKSIPISIGTKNYILNKFSKIDLH